MKILVINSGSSSLKFTLFSMEKNEEKVLASGIVERLGLENPKIIYKNPAQDYKSEDNPPIPDYDTALQLICGKLTDPEHGVIRSFDEVGAIGHRVLHGGSKVFKPVLIDEAVKDIIRDCIPLGPLHNPANLSGIEACEQIFPGVPNIGLFDTAFHQTMPPEAYLYAIPRKYYEEYGIRRYGFHGTSHQYVCGAAAEFVGKKPEEVDMITCHLGNGCSMAAIRKGKVIDTTMGLTPLEGLMMGGRCGDLDPAVVLRFADMGMNTNEIDRLMNKQSGLLAVAEIGSSDMRDISAAIEKGNERARLALDMFVRRVVKYIGAYYVLFEKGPELLVFTGGIGEYSTLVRRLVMEKLSALNIFVDVEANNAAFGKKGVISTPESSWKALVIPTNEELMIARGVLGVLGVEH